jgi:very-short-patch-repair endonuclease
MAAVLAFGDGVVLSHMSAAALWGLLRPETGPIDVSLPSKSGRSRRQGIRIHRCASVAGSEKAGDRLGVADRPQPPELEARATLVTVRRSIPVTTVARTVHDLGRTSPPHLVRRAIRQAQLAGHALDPATKTDRTRSDLERDFLDLCRRHGLPAPEVNVKVGRWTVDFLWRRQRLAVETDSDRFHRGGVAFEDDHARDLDLRAAGFAVRRFSERQVEDEPDRVAADVAAGLS